MRYFLLILLLSCTQLQAQAVIDSIQAPGPGITGLAWDGAYLWVASTRRDSIFQMDASTGAIVSAIPFDIEDEYGGLAWDEDSTLWIANKDSIFELDPATGEVLSGYHAPGC